jgi:hypothetical protein
LKPTIWFDESIFGDENHRWQDRRLAERVQHGSVHHKSRYLPPAKTLRTNFFSGIIMKILWGKGGQAILPQSSPRIIFLTTELRAK